MLNCTTASIRSLGAGARLGTRLRGSYAVPIQKPVSSLSRRLLHIAQQLRHSSSSGSFGNNEAFALDGGAQQPCIRIGRDSTKGRRSDYEHKKPFDVAARKSRLEESFRFSRHQTKQARRGKYSGGNLKEVKMLEDLAKTRELPEGVSATVVNKELKWLKDPKELATRVARLLQADQAPLAVAIVRKAEGLKMECSAAWNRLLAFCFQKSAPQAAFSFYNDMKKRHRQPTDRTYTTMLKGLSVPIKRPGWNPVPIAQKIYRQLVDPNSTVSPSLYHHHAMLEVCGNYHDIDALWDVVGELPEHGPARPNAQTYTVILLALQNSFEHAVESLSTEVADDIKTRSEKRESLLLDVKRIWADVISQWKDGELELDNELVNTMAQILLDPLDDSSSYNVLAMFNQTLGIPILARKPQIADSFGSEKKLVEEVVPPVETLEDVGEGRVIQAETDMDEPSQQDVSGKDELGLTDEKVYVEDLEDVFDPVERKAGSEAEIQQVTADNTILNSILKTCRTMTQGTSAGKLYWKYFTIDAEADSLHKLKPDIANFHEYLRLLRVARASQGAVEMIRDQMIPAVDVQGLTFHLAMSCCLRDRQNPNVFLNAQELLSLMEKNVPLPDPRPLQGFLNLVDALLSNPQWLLGLRGLASANQETTNLTTMGRNLRWSLQKAAISNIEPHLNRLYEAMEHPSSVHSSGYVPEARPGMVNGFYALNFMVQTRQMLDKLLGTHYKTTLSEADRTWLHDLATKLRKFSRPDVALKFENSQLTPLRKHWEILAER